MRRRGSRLGARRCPTTAVPNSGVTKVTVKSTHLPVDKKQPPHIQMENDPIHPPHPASGPHLPEKDPTIMTTSTSTPTPRRTKFRRGSALAAIACTVGVSAGSAVLGAAPAQALSSFAGCSFNVAKVDGVTGLPLAGASFKVATADGSAKLLTPAQALQVSTQFAALVAPYQALVDADNSGVGVSSYGYLKDDANGATPAQKVFDVQASIDILAARDAETQAHPIPSSAAAGFDTSAVMAFDQAIHIQLAAERAYVAGGGSAPVSTIAPAPAADRVNYPKPALEAAIARSRMIIVQQALPAPIAAQLAAIKAPFEVTSLTGPTQANGILGIEPAILAGGSGDPATVAVDSGPTVGGTTVPITITETVAPQGFALDTSPQTLPVGFDSCAPLSAAPPAPGSPAWTVTKAHVGNGFVVTATLRDAVAAVVVPPVVTPPVTTPPVTTPPVIPPVVVPPVVTPPVTTPPVIPPVVTTPPVVVVPPVVTTPPVVVPVVPVVPAPVVTPAPVVVPVIPAPGVAIAVPVAPAPASAPSTTRVAPPRGVDAGMAPAADSSSSSGQRLRVALLGLTGLAGAGGLFARRRS